MRKCSVWLGSLLCAIALAALAACTPAPLRAPIEYLDERTGLTLSIVDRPMVLARERREVAANARDYLTIVAVIRDESGKLTPLLLVHRWSTIDARVAPSSAGAAPPLVLVADGRDIRLDPLSALPRELAARERRLWWPEDAAAQSFAAHVDAALLDYLATSQRLSAHFDDPADPQPYDLLWSNGKDALARLAAVASVDAPALSPGARASTKP